MRAWVRRCRAAAAAASAWRRAGSAWAATAWAVGSPGLLLRGVGHGLEVLRDLALGGGGLLPRLGEADGVHQGFEAADFGGQVLVARGLAALALQALDLALQLADHVLDANEVVLGGLEAQLRLVAAGMEARDAGGILQDAAAGLGLGGDDLADLALADEGRRAGAGGGIREQDLHVAGADFLAVDPVGRAFLTLDLARDFQEIAVVEGGRRRALAVVDGEHHLGPVAGRTAP